MKNKIIWIVICCLMLFSFISITTSIASARDNWWDKFGEPQYGGTLTFAAAGLMAVNFDVYNFIGSENNFWFEAMFEPDWMLDRKIWPMTGMFVPDKYWKGNLAESWELTDAKTIIVHIRKGIRWQDKTPVNGREFTAYDVQAHYDRVLGTGGGYTWKAPMYTGMTANWEKVTATDKYTVVYKFKAPSAQNFQSITDRVSLNTIEAPEWVKLGGPPTPPAKPKGGPPPGGGPPPPPSFGHGPLQDWRNAVGTGPWMLGKYVEGTSFTFVKNPNYWGHDPRHPQNKLPYADKLVMLIIPDLSTRVAALRTGKIDILTSGGVGTIGWQQAKSIGRSNPEFLQSKQPNGAGGIGFRVDKKPFTDIRVRKALNIAIDRKAIAQSIFGGTSDGNPVGLITQGYKGYAFDYNDWPKSLKDEYVFNPKKAKQLLAKAGYPKGFKTNVVTSNADSTVITLLQAYKSYFKDIGVDMEIRAMDSITTQAFTRAGKHDQMSNQGGAFTFPPVRAIDAFYSKGTDAAYYGINDAKYDSLRVRFLDATDATKAARICQQIDRHVIEQHWLVLPGENYVYNIWHPYLKGYSGEGFFWGQGITWSRLWVDKELKK